MLASIDRLVEKVLGLTPAEAEALRDLASAVTSGEESDAGATPDDAVPTDDGPAQAADFLTYFVLRILGRDWPTPPTVQVEVDSDGIIPLTEGTGEPTLGSRIKAALPEPGCRALAEMLGAPLDEWLLHDFFRRHLSQFKKRPPAWQIQSEPTAKGPRRGRGPRPAPVFACLVYCGRVDADLIPKLRSHYVGPLRTRLDTELAGLEKIAGRTAEQDSRRLELEERIEELKAFDTRLEHVTVEGFASPVLDSLGTKEPLDEWTSCDGRQRPPETRKAFLAQERRYDPDINDGMRVNIAPLQRAGLLAADVLAAKDVEKAIADRAEWRADERRWCREGKLPRPGWWPARKDA